MGVVTFVVVAMVMAAGGLYANPVDPFASLVDKIVLVGGTIFVLSCLVRADRRKDRLP